MQPQLPPSKAVGFKPLAEEWNYYSIDDGYVVGVRIVLTKVMKTTQSAPDGSPVYVINVSPPVIQVLTQEEYRNITSRNMISK